MDKLPGVLWAYRTSIKTPTEESLFTLVYECEVVTPVEIGLSSYRISYFLPLQNNEVIEEHLDLIEDERDIAEVQMAEEKVKAERYFNKKVKSKNFKIGKLVLKRSGITIQSEEKMESRWERLYILIANNKPGSYKLKDKQGKELPHPWNIEHLRKYYQ